MHSAFQQRQRHQPDRRTGHRLRGGYTLLEMVLVLGLLVILLALAWPSLNTLRWEQNLKQGAEVIRLQLVSARLHAMESGIPYQFRFEPGGQRFVIVPAEYQSIQAAASAPSNTSGEVNVKYWKTTGKFTAKVNFDVSATTDKGLVAQPLPREFLADFQEADELGQVSWGAPLVFQPDGSARDFELDVVDTEGHAVTLVVRGLTGGATVSSIKRKAG